MAEMPGGMSRASDIAAGLTADDVAPWPRVYELLRGASNEGLFAHGVAPLAARAARLHGQEVGQALEWEERRAAFNMVGVVPLLERIRLAVDARIVLMKGPALTVGYPGYARSFSDLDLLVDDPRRVHRELRSAGFVEVGEPELFYRIHHLRPLQWPTIPIALEIHREPKWPERLVPPRAEEILDAAVHSGLAPVEILVPSPEHHALLVAAHAWAHEPLWRLRDLIDVYVAASSADPVKLERVARSWGVRRLWRTTAAAVTGVLEGGRMPLAARTWARHLVDVRERTVLEDHLQQWFGGYWSLPLPAALAATGAAVASDVLPAPEEGWGDKVKRARKALRSPTAPLSAHHREIGDAATRGRRRNLPDDPEEDDPTLTGS